MRADREGEEEEEGQTVVSRRYAREVHTRNHHCHVVRLHVFAFKPSAFLGELYEPF